MGIQRRLAVDRIDQRHHALQTVTQVEIGMAEHRLQHRRGIGQPCGFDHHSGESRNPAIVDIAQQVFERRDQFAAHRAAQAARRQQNGVLVLDLDKQMIKADRAELVDDHRRTRHRGIVQQAVEQGGFARAQKSGQHKKRDHVRPFGHFELLHASAAIRK